jgi:hypothetical protein
MSDMVNLVRVLTSATGNSTPITLGTAYSQLFMTPAEAGAVNGRTYTYLIVDANNWELGKGVYTSSGNTLARTTILASRNAGTLGTSRISLSGTAQVRFVQAAEDIGGLGGTRSVTLTTDAIASTDRGRAIAYSNASAIAVSLAQAGTAGFFDGWATWIKNTGAGAVTITPATSTINGAATLVLPTNIGAFIWSDGTNYHALMLPIGRPLLAANNLSDLANADTALGNLGGTTLGKSLFKAATAAAARTSAGAVGAVRSQVFTSSGTYTPDPHLLYAVIECLGGGGGGGGANCANAAHCYGGSGGGAGSYARKYVAAATVTSSQSVTIGSGGGGGPGSTNGGAGGDTSVGSLCTGKGASGGLYGAITQFPTGGPGGVAGTGDFTPAGARGISGAYQQVNTLTVASGSGANSPFGGAGSGQLSNSSAANGFPATNYGSGGGGAIVHGVVATATGGAGSAGVVVITEFCSE